MKINQRKVICNLHGHSKQQKENSGDDNFKSDDSKDEGYFTNQDNVNLRKEGSKQTDDSKQKDDSKQIKTISKTEDTKDIHKTVAAKVTKPFLLKRQQYVKVK